MVRPGSKLKAGAKVLFGDGLLKATVLEVLENGNRKVEFEYKGIFNEILDQIGLMPLPPYITEATKEDNSKYQTVYAKYDGSAAAPTAGLPFPPVPQSVHPPNGGAAGRHPTTKGAVRTEHFRPPPEHRQEGGAGHGAGILSPPAGAIAAAVQQSPAGAGHHGRTHPGEGGQHPAGTGHCQGGGLPPAHGGGNTHDPLPLA